MSVVFILTNHFGPHFTINILIIPDLSSGYLLVRLFLNFILFYFIFFLPVTVLYVLPHQHDIIFITSPSRANSNLPHIFCGCPSVAGQLQNCEQVEESSPLLEENGGEEAHPGGDLPEVLQDGGEQMEDRADEDIQTGTSPPQVPLKLLPQMSAGDGESACVCV